jgi:pimeloyl-ACP methyl ester carboxylesterase
MFAMRKEGPLNGSSRFQFWFFFYDTGNAIPYSALRLRQALSEAVKQIDPEGRDPALQQMVLIGHSQGGLLARMAAIESGERFWKGISSRPIDELYVSEATRDLLRQVFFFEPLPFVRRLVFLATPHRGSFVAEGPLANLLARFVQLPQTLAGATGDLVTGNPDTLRFDPRRPVFGSVYGMRPGSFLLTTLDETPIAPGVQGALDHPGARRPAASRTVGRGRALRERAPRLGGVGAGGTTFGSLGAAQPAGHRGGPPHPRRARRSGVPGEPGGLRAQPAAGPRRGCRRIEPVRRAVGGGGGTRAAGG